MGTEGSTVLSPLWRELPPIDSSVVSTSASCTLPPRFEAVGNARKFTRAMLERWELGALFDEVALVVSELVTNSMRYALPADRRDRLRDLDQLDRLDRLDQLDRLDRLEGTGGPGMPAGGDVEPFVRLHLMRWTSRLVCAVRDPSETGPVVGEGEADAGAECGRGLFLVESFSDAWGWHPLAGAAHGKVVWALFRLPRERD